MTIAIVAMLVAAAPAYSVITLRSLGGSASGASSIDDAGWISGLSTLPGDQVVHAALWVHGLAVDFRRLRRFDDARSTHPEFDHSILVQIAIHHFDLMRAILGRDPVRVYCHTWRPPASGSKAPQAAAAVIEFDGGTVASYRGSMVSSGAQTPWGGVWRIECADGDILLQGPEYPGEPGAVEVGPRDAEYVEIRPRAGAVRKVELPTLPSNRLGVLEAFVHAVESGTELPISGQNNLPSLALMIAAGESARQGRAVPVG